MLRPYSPFYNKVTRAYVICFGDLFNEIYIQKFRKNGDVHKTIQVPISYSKKERYLTRLKQDYNVEGDENDTKIAMILPRMGYDIVDIQYDSSRKTNGLNMQTQLASSDSKIARNAGIPYNFSFELYITTKEIDEMYQIVEQILPYFQPWFNLNIKDSKDFSFGTDCPLLYNGTVMEDTYEGDPRDGEGRRVLIWTLSFTLKGYLYGPTTALPLIKQVEINHSDYNCEPLQTIIVKVDPWEAGPDDAYGYDIEVIDYGQ